ncbi:dTDP-4-dehydrorhamnose 3,5-epimerase [bacterium HR40]|nr:dTDP-4-dehydrorhamnose 3,5-epimerase [bacterium HR40]
METVTRVEGAAASELAVTPTTLPGVLLLTFPRHDDRRGWFGRAFCRDSLRHLGIDLDPVQANLSLSRRRGTLRGLHYQLPPSAETKLVRCLAGAILDVVLDLRPHSPTFGRHMAVELEGGAPRAVLVPPGCAHGFLTLTDDTLVLYFVSARYDPARERGVRFDDPTFAIRWPFPPEVVSDRDLAHPDFDPAIHLRP